MAAGGLEMSGGVSVGDFGHLAADADGYAVGKATA